MESEGVSDVVGGAVKEELGRRGRKGLPAGGGVQGEAAVKVDSARGPRELQSQREGKKEGGGKERACYFYAKLKLITNNLLETYSGPPVLKILISRSFYT